MKTLLVAGFSTTVDTLCVSKTKNLLILIAIVINGGQYTYTLLSKHPEVMKRLREEHDRIFGPDISTTAETIRQYPYKINELDYTTAVLKETLRFFPIGSATKENPPGT